MKNKSAEIILLDADALVALAKEDDSNHNKALKIKEVLDGQDVDFYITSFTIPEAATVISYKVDHSSALKFLKSARSSDFFNVEINNELITLSDKWFEKQNQNKGISYFDCVNMAALELLETNLIFSFDKGYKKNGFSLTEEVV